MQKKESSGLKLHMVFAMTPYICFRSDDSFFKRSEDNKQVCKSKVWKIQGKSNYWEYISKKEERNVLIHLKLKKTNLEAKNEKTPKFSFSISKRKIAVEKSNNLENWIKRHNVHKIEFSSLLMLALNFKWNLSFWLKGKKRETFRFWIHNFSSHPHDEVFVSINAYIIFDTTKLT